MKSILIRVSYVLIFCQITLLAVAQGFRHLDQTYTAHTYESREEWLGRAEELREHILVSNGLWPLEQRSPDEPIVSEPLRRSGYTIQNVVIETLPGFYLTGNLYRPESGAGPFPAVLTAHGHWDNGRLENTELASIPGRAINFARQGYVVFSYSMIGYNETAGIIPHRFDEPRFQLWGFSAMGLQLWNSLRALDFLTSLPDVDPERVGMTGASGGGTQTFMLTAVDPRVRVAAPVNMISAIMQGGCVCENAPLLRLDANNIEIGALAAPRPLLMVSTTGDWTRNTPQVEYPAMKAIYRLFDAEERVANVHLNYEHNYNRDSREAVYSWFARWLLNRNEPVSEQPFQVEKSEVLLARLPGEPRSLDALYSDHVERSRSQIQQYKPSNWSDIYRYRDAFGTALHHILESPDLVYAVPEPISPVDRVQASEAVLIVYPGETVAAKARTLAESHVEEGRLVFLLNPYPEGASFTPPDTINHWNTYNPTVASTRIGEIRAVVEQILDRPDVTALDLIGLEASGPFTLLARAVTPGIRRTEIDFNGFDADSDETFLDSLFIPLLRKAGDFKTAAALIVPAPLSIRNMPPGATGQWIEEVYRTAGAQEMLKIQ